MKRTISKIGLAERVITLVEGAQQEVIVAANLAQVYSEVMPSKLAIKRIILEENRKCEKERLLSLAEAKEGRSL